MFTRRIHLFEEIFLSKSLKDITSRNGLFFNSNFCFSSREKISLFKAHQDRQIQDRIAEDRDILAYNDQRKVAPESKDLTPIEIANFDIYYGRFESVFTQGSGRARKVIKSLRKYDIELILHNKLGNDSVKILDFIHSRGSQKLKCAEIIYILEYFVKHPQKLAELQENNQIHSIFEIIFTALANVSIYSSKELVRLLKLMVYFGVEREDVWKNLLTKANLLFSNRNELEEAYASVSIVMTIFLNRTFNDLASKAMVLQLKKKLLRNLDSLDVKDCVRLFVLIAERSMFLDPLQLKNFESRFIANQESMSLNDLAEVFDAFAKMNFYSIELTEYFMKYRMAKIKEIVPPARLNNTDKLISQYDNKNSISISSNSQLVLIEPMEKDEETLLEGQIYLHSYVSLLKGFSYTQALIGQENQNIWDNLEDLLCVFITQHIKPNQMDRLFSSFQVKSIISCWEKNQRGSKNVWEVLANRGEIDLSYDENYIVLKNLCAFNVQNLSQLNLTLSYIIDDKTELPQFEKILGKSNARKIIEKLEVYSVVIYKYIESTQNHDRSDKKAVRENNFQKLSMLALLRAAVNSLIKGNDRKWKSLNSQESLRLYGLLILCDHKSAARWDSDDLGSLERSLLKDKASFSGKEVAFIALMTEAFGNEQQQEKWGGFISNCIQHASQLEFSNYFCQFYKHGLGNAYIWSLLQLKFVHHMELFSLQDLLSCYLGIASKTNVDEEIWELFYELVKIKGVSRSHKEMLEMFNKKLSMKSSGNNYPAIRITQIQEVIDNLEKSAEEDNQDEETVEFNYIESLGLQFEKLVSEEEFVPLSVFQAGNIQHVLNLIR